MLSAPSVALISIYSTRGSGQTCGQKIRPKLDVVTIERRIFLHINLTTSISAPYAHSSDEMKRAAAKKIDRTLGAVVGGKTAAVEREPENEQQEPVRPQKRPKAKFEPYRGKIRRPGTGYIHQVSKNTWQGRYSPVVDGKRVARNVYASSPEECEEKLAELIKMMKAEIAEMKMEIHA